MYWHDEGVVLTLRRYGENAALLRLLTRERGAWSGLVYAPYGRRLRGVLQPGSLVAAAWRGRPQAGPGVWRCEPLPGLSPFACLMSRPGPLTALGCACALVSRILPEGEAYEGVFFSLTALGERLSAGGWARSYVCWEYDLLAHVGYGLGLERCVLGGAADEVVYASPGSGGGVSFEAAGRWRSRLLPVPAFLAAYARQGIAGGVEEGEIACGLALTGHFLERHAMVRLPPQRGLLAEYADERDKRDTVGE